MPRSPTRRQLSSHLLVGEEDISNQHLADAAERSFNPIRGGFMIPIERIDTWDQQPRRLFDDKKIDELAASIADTGMLEPLLVRRHPDKPGFYVILAGHRRLLAARRLHGSANPQDRSVVDVLPCVVREVSEEHAFADALAENLVRTDLTRRETMEALLRLQEDYGWTGYAIAKRTGRNESDISILLRVARHQELAELVYEEVISPTAAGLIERLDDQEAQQEAMALVRAGRLKTVDDILRYRDKGRESRRADAAVGQPNESEQPERGLVSSDTHAMPARPNTVISQHPSPGANGAGNTVISQHEAAPSRELDAVSATDPTLGPDTGGSDGGIVTPAEMVVVGEHVRRKAGSGPASPSTHPISDEQVARLARDIVTFVQSNGRLTSGQLVLLGDAHAQLGAYLAAQTEQQRVVLPS